MDETKEKSTAEPAVSTRNLQFGPGEMDRVASLNMEIERLQSSNTPNALARTQELIEERTRIINSALARQQNRGS